MFPKNVLPAQRLKAAEAKEQEKLIEEGETSAQTLAAKAKSAEGSTMDTVGTMPLEPFQNDGAAEEVLSFVFCTLLL